MSRRRPFLVLALLGVACAPGVTVPAASPGGSAPARHPPAPATPATVQVPRTIVTPDDAKSITDLYEHARGLLKAGDNAGAGKEFDRVVALDPKGPLAADALFGAGEAHDLAADQAGALARYEETARRFPEADLARAALVRSVRLLAFLERWEKAGETADLLLARYHDLRPFESIVAMSGKALALINTGDLDAATYYIEKSRNVVDDNHFDEAGRIPRDLAQLYYALGEVRRIRAERITFVPVPANFGAVLEQRCQLLLDAQSAYSDAMRAYDAHWSAMAGYRVGELYEKLHEDLMQVPAPRTAGSEADRQLFEGAMRLRYSVLLQKALAMMNHTVQMADRTGERSAWVLKAEDARAAIERAMKAEDAAIGRLPYTRAQLQAALDRLAERKKH